LEGFPKFLRLHHQLVCLVVEQELVEVVGLLPLVQLLLQVLVVLKICQ
jgi:hypothetical protein